MDICQCFTCATPAFAADSRSRPRDGHNISVAQLLNALQNPETYNISGPLARVLVYGGGLMMHEAGAISLHKLAEHGRIEHDASVVHTNTEAGHIYAPTRCDTVLLNELLADDDYVTLDRIAQRRFELEKLSKLDPVHQEIARGEWALVLGIFGKAHEGKVPSDELRVWLKENRFPDGWKPTHQQGLFETVKLSSAIREKMNEYQTEENLEGMSISQGGGLAGVTKHELQEAVKQGRAVSPVPDPRPPKRQKSEGYTWS